MNKLGSRLKQLRINNALTQQNVADYCGGLRKASVSAWEGDKAKPTLDAIMRLCSLYQVTSDEILTGYRCESIGAHSPVKVPLITWDQISQAPEPFELNDITPVDHIPCAERHSSNTYALEVNGHSMTSATGRSYPQGRVIICDPSLAPTAASGQRVIARMDDTGILTFKELVSEDGRQWLRPLNTLPQYQPILEPFTVLAVVISSYIPE